MTDETVMHECWSCGVRFWITKRLDDCRRQDKRTFYCPNGHGANFGKSEADKVREQLDAMRRERDRLKQNEAYYEQTLGRRDEEVREAKREKAALKRQLKKTHTRISAGVCPCCNRQFVNLQRHMASKHAGFSAEPVQQEQAA